MEKTIKLSDGFYITTDPMNFILNRSIVSFGNGANKTDKPRLVDKQLGYYGTLEKCLKGYIEELQNAGTEDFVGTVEEYIKRIQDINNAAVAEIRRLLK